MREEEVRWEEGMASLFCALSLVLRFQATEQKEKQQGNAASQYGIRGNNFLCLSKDCECLPFPLSLPVLALMGRAVGLLGLLISADQVL